MKEPTENELKSALAAALAELPIGTSVTLIVAARVKKNNKPCLYMNRISNEKRAVSKYQIKKYLKSMEHTDKFGNTTNN